MMQTPCILVKNELSNLYLKELTRDLDNFITGPKLLAAKMNIVNIPGRQVKDDMDICIHILGNIPSEYNTVIIF